MIYPVTVFPLSFISYPKPTTTPPPTPNNSPTSSWIPTVTGSHQVGPVCSILLPTGYRTYRAGIKRFQGFCEQYQVHNLLPVTERLFYQFAAFLANQGLAPLTAKTYLAVIHMQLSLDLPDPCDIYFNPPTFEVTTDLGEVH